MGLPLTAQPVCVSVSVPFIRSSDFYSAGSQAKHVTLTQCWSNVGPLSTTVTQH